MTVTELVKNLDIGAAATGGAILIERGAERVRRAGTRPTTTRRIRDDATFHIVQRDGRRVSSQKPRKLSVAVGTGGCRDAVRAAQAETIYRVSQETCLVSLFDLDLYQEGALLNALPSHLPALCLHGDENNPHLGLGLLNKSLSQQKALRHFWQPPLSDLKMLVEHTLKLGRLYPSIVIEYLITGGGHGLPGLTMAAWIAVMCPYARRVGIVIVPEEERKRQQLLEVLALYDRYRVNGRPIVDTIFFEGDNRLDPDRQDEMGPHMIACAESAVTSGNQRGDNLGNIFSLPNQPETDGIHYLTYRWCRASVPVTRPLSGSFFQRLFSTSKSSPESDVVVVTEEAFRVADTLASGGGTPAFLAPLDAKVGTALFLGIPSAGWEIVEHAKQTVEERLRIKGPIDHNRKGPVMGRYDLPPTDSAPIVGVIMGEIEGGLAGVEHGITAAHLAYDSNNERPVLQAE